MPFITECASAIKKRFGKPEQPPESLPATRSSPDLFKSASKDGLFNSSTALVRSYSDIDEDSASIRSFELIDDPSFWKDHNVQVIIRVRPLSSSEISVQGHNRCVKQDSAQTITWSGHPESRFTFDVVADENVSQEMLFQVAGVPMVENCVGGYNSCMFAYGQTGSGKTHTMLGDIEGGTRRHSVNCGMTPRVFEYLFSRIQKEREARREEKLRFTCKCSFLEIYNEQILDLLDPSSTNLHIREDTKKGVYVENLTEVEVTSARDVLQQLVQGSANRKVASTNMNRASSRSHSVFTCIIESKWESQGVIHHRFARLNLVDLAGSERQKSSGAEGERLKEATNINKSLSTLGLVIMNLVSASNGKSQHVPYRDSKLTFLLQDSLGGNSKTIIIANISPSTCCSLETLSTLKFAQRAKFIKNHAIVNEDASGDVLAMRVQIQQLKKEVARLKGLSNGGVEISDGDVGLTSFPGSPGSFKWDGLFGSLSPLLSNKRASHNKEYEVALVGAFRREKDRDVTLQALTAEVQAAMQLAKQREDEIQGLKMRLRFREAGIKRLEAVASGKISAEAHLLEEKEELSKEIEVLRGQVDRNQEVTRFAMENLRLKEEIRRLKSFYEEGERESMHEQIMTLQNKLLEALDWKLMHESDPTIVQKENSDQANNSLGDGDLLAFTQETGSLVNEEIEFLRMQAFQNQSEIDLLQKKLNSCIDERENLERKTNELLSELEAERSLKKQNEEQKLQIQHPSLISNQIPNIYSNDQTEELEAMVVSIAAASQREAEAHETASKWFRENEELRSKIKVLIDDNNKLIELYEKAASDGANKSSGKEKELPLKKEVENLEQQLNEMHEENEKLLVLYEKAMQERDEFKRKLALETQNDELKGDFGCSEMLVEVDSGESHMPHESPVSEMGNLNLETLNLSDEINKEIDFLEDSHPDATFDEAQNDELKGDFSCPEKLVELDRGEPHMIHQSPVSVMGTLNFENLNLLDEDSHRDPTDEIDVDSISKMDLISSNLTTVKLSQELDLVRMKLNAAEEKLASSLEKFDLFGTVKEAIDEVDSLSTEIGNFEDDIKAKQQEFLLLETLSSEINERVIVADRKLMALKYSLSSFSSSVAYFEQRQIQAQTKVDTSLVYLNCKKEQFAFIEAKKKEYMEARRRFQLFETESTDIIEKLTLKLREKQESEKVLFAIDNLEKANLGKATDLLKSQEEKTKIQIEINQEREKLSIKRKENEELCKKLKKLEKEAESLQIEIEKAEKSLKEKEQKLRDVCKDKEMLLEMKENGSAEIQNMILEYFQLRIEAELKKAETEILDGEIKIAFDRVSGLQIAKLFASEWKDQLLGDMRYDEFLEEIQEIGDAS